MKKIVFIALIAIVLVALSYYFLIQPKPVQPTLELLRTYEPPKGEFVSPEFITQGLPEGFYAGTATSYETTYPDGTKVSVKLLTYAKNEFIVVVEVLNVSGDKLIENTPNVEEYELKNVEILGNRIIKYTIPDYEYGYIWNYGRYSIIVNSPVVSEEFPPHLNEFAELYLRAYPSTM
jgi:hypothetical protein